MSPSIRSAISAAFALFLFALATPLAAQRGGHYDPPSRVARLAHAEGSVSFSPAGTDEWRRVQRNRPHWRGDRFWTDRRSRAELELGGAALRLDERTAIEILDFDDRTAQFELTEGSANLSVRYATRGDVYEIATPMLALVLDRAANVKIDVDPRSGRTEIVVWRGQAIAYGERGRFALRDGDAVRFYDPSLRDYDFFDPRPDGFDAYADARERRLERSTSLRYVPAGLIGYSDLDTYGAWRPHAEYGNVWFPSRVSSGWRPFRDGHWIYQEPWGWTWIDDAEWGFATSHYGRWVQVDRRWGWIPSPRRERPVYAPALVGFVGGFSSGSSGPVGWFPLGPTDPYLPSYRTSRDYFNRVNTGNYAFADRGIVDRAWTAYQGGRGHRYQYRYANPDTVVAVPRDVFVNARPVARASVPYRGESSAVAQLDRIKALAPSTQSVYGVAPAATAVPQEQIFEREVFARHAPRTTTAPAGGVGPEVLHRDASQPGENLRMIRGEGQLIPRDAPRDEVGGMERDRGIDTGTAQRDAATAAEAARQAETARQAEAARAEQERQQRDASQAQQREAEARQRETERQQREAEQAAQQEQQRRQREAEQAQREAERQQHEAAQAQVREEARRGREAEEQQRAVEVENERARREAEQAQREQERQQREAEQAQREAERQQREAEQAQQRQQREQQQAQQEAERAQREQGQAQAAEQERQQREAEQAQREAERQQREAEQAQREQERQQREAAQAAQDAEQAQREAEREAERAAREAEREERRRKKDEIEGEEQPQ